jgi:hypothetical protein
MLPRAPAAAMRRGPTRRRARAPRGAFCSIEQAGTSSNRASTIAS